MGILAPLLFFIWHPFRVFIAGDNGSFLWPSGIWLMATYGHEHEFSAYAIIGMSVLANVLLYAGVTSLLWFVVWIIQCVATHTS